MNTVLVVDLPAQLSADAECAWALCDAGEPVESGRAPFAQLPSGRAQRIVGVVAAECAAVIPCDLPVLANSRLAAALKGALEDKVLGDDDESVLAAAAPVDGRVRQAAAVRREWLDRLMELSRAQQLGWSALVPELGLLAPNQAYVKGEETALLCAPNGETCALPLSAVPPGQWQQLKLPMAAWLARAASSPWNLLQGDFAQRASIGRVGQWLGLGWREGWLRPLAWGAVALAAVTVLGINLKAWQLRQRLAAYQAEQVALLKRAAPKLDVIVDAPLQLRRELRQLRAATGQPNPGDAEAMLAALHVAGSGADKWQRVEYKAGELSISGIAASDGTLQALRARGYQAGIDGGTLKLKGAP
jgi:general secretion pathway protein L